MFDSGNDITGGGERRGSSTADVPEFRAWAASLQALDRDVSDPERVDQLRGLEELSCAIAAAQAQISVDLEASVRSEDERRSVARDEVGRGAAAQIALARRIPPLAPPAGSRSTGRS